MEEGITKKVMHPSVVFQTSGTTTKTNNYFSGSRFCEGWEASMGSNNCRYVSNEDLGWSTIHELLGQPTFASLHTAAHSWRAIMHYLWQSGCSGFQRVFRVSAIHKLFQIVVAHKLYLWDPASGCSWKAHSCDSVCWRCMGETFRLTRLYSKSILWENWMLTHTW